MPPKRTTEVKYYTLTDSGYIEIDATPQELETYLEESQEWQRVKHGQWLWVDGVRCSICNYKLQTTGLPSYCPNCGAKMDVTK